MEKVSIVVTNQEFLIFKDILTKAGFTLFVKDKDDIKVINIETDKLLKLKFAINRAKNLTKTQKRR